MAKIPRIPFKVFGSAGLIDFFGQFGSEQSGNPLLTKDLTQIQALPAYIIGLSAATNNGTSNPWLNDINSLYLLFSSMIAYLFQDGVPAYDAATTYFENSFCKVGKDIYVSKVDDNTGNSPPSRLTYWELFSAGGINLQSDYSSTAVNLDVENNVQYRFGFLNNLNIIFPGTELFSEIIFISGTNPTVLQVSGVLWKNNMPPDIEPNTVYVLTFHSFYNYVIGKWEAFGNGQVGTIANWVDDNGNNIVTENGDNIVFLV